MANSNMYFSINILNTYINTTHPMPIPIKAEFLPFLISKSFRLKHPILSLGKCPESIVPGQFPITSFEKIFF